MSDCLSAVLVPGPLQTWKASTVLGSEISIGVLRSAPLIVILTIFAFATSGVGTLRISKQLSKTASPILMLGPPARCSWEPALPHCTRTKDAKLFCCRRQWLQSILVDFQNHSGVAICDLANFVFRCGAEHLRHLGRRQLVFVCQPARHVCRGFAER